VKQLVGGERGLKTPDLNKALDGKNSISFKEKVGKKKMFKEET